MKACVQLGGVLARSAGAGREIGVPKPCLQDTLWEMAAAAEPRADEPILTLRGKLKKGIIP